MKRILVAGGAGFIGSHLCEALLKKGHEVICLDNLVTGYRKNVEGLADQKNFHFIGADTRELVIDKPPFAGAIDEIYDLASPASVTYVCEHPIETATVNSIGTKNLLDLARKFQATFLFASSSEVYGDPNVHPQPELYWGNVNPIGVRSGYDEGKRFGETLTAAYRRERKVEGKIARIFNTYGPRSSISDSRVVPSFITKAIRGEPLTVHGNGSQTRSFCYVTDMVSGLIRLMEQDEAGPINIGNPEEHTIFDMAKKIIQMTESHSQIIFVERPVDDPSKRKPDIRLAKKKLRWEPKVHLDDGLRQTIDYFRMVV